MGNAVLAAAATEDDLLVFVRQLAGLKGWLSYHTHNSKHSEAGFPDLVLARPPRLIFAELKNARRKATPEQEQWLHAAVLCGAESYLWRPVDLNTIIEVLA